MRRTLSIFVLVAFLSTVFAPTFAMAAPHNQRPQQRQSQQIKQHRPHPQGPKGTKPQFRSMADQERKFRPKFERDIRRTENPGMYQFHKPDRKKDAHHGPKDRPNRLNKPNKNTPPPKHHIQKPPHHPPKHHIPKPPPSWNKPWYRHHPHNHPRFGFGEKLFYHGMYLLLINGQYIVAPSSYWIQKYSEALFVQYLIQGLAFEVWHDGHNWARVPYYY